MSVPTDALIGTEQADAEPDDVALRRALRAVARGEDADVVAAQAQALVQERDVLGDAAAGRVDVRADQADLHGRVRLSRSRAAGFRIEQRRSGAPARIAVVATRAVATHAARHLVAHIAGALAELLAEHPELPGRAVERATVLGRAGGDRRAQLVGGAARNVVQPVPTASSACASLLPICARCCSIGEAHDTIVPRSAERRRVERLQRVGAERASSGSSSRRRSTQPWAHSG